MYFKHSTIPNMEICLSLESKDMKAGGLESLHRLIRRQRTRWHCKRSAHSSGGWSIGWSGQNGRGCGRCPKACPNKETEIPPHNLEENSSSTK